MRSTGKGSFDVPAVSERTSRCRARAVCFARASGRRASAGAARRFGAAARARRAGAGAGRRRPRRARPPRRRTPRPRRASAAGNAAPERFRARECACDRREARAARRASRVSTTSRPSADAALELVVGDDQRLVVLADPARRLSAVEHVARGRRSAAASMCFSNASPWSSALCAHCSTERSGKWKHSIGNQPRSGANGLSTSAWLPRVSRISGCPRWMILRIGLYSDAGSLIGASAEKRTVIRSAKCSSPGRGQKTRRNAPTVP